MPDKRAFTILALYQFVDPLFSSETVQALKEKIHDFLTEHKARGAILLSTEGINGTICYPTNDSSSVLQFFQTHFDKLRKRISYDSSNVFFRLRVRIKSEIVTMGIDGISPTQRVGQYVKPDDWDSFVIHDPDCLVIDTRNDYEVQLGTFRNAVNPGTQSFTELPAWLEHHLVTSTKKPSKIAMFCTGGIRCEKATSYCMTITDIPVYHLEGGILAYLDEKKKKQESDDATFEGECYVFDQRTAVTYGLQPSQHFESCHACRHPLTPHDRQHPDYRAGVVCPYCKLDETHQAKRSRYEARNKHIQVALQKGITHLGQEHHSTAKPPLEPYPVSRRGIPQV